MKFRKQISLILAVSMVFGSVNAVFADDIYKTPGERGEEIVAPMAADEIEYPVEGGNIRFDKSTGTVTYADKP